jgi:Arylsulfotransferase (ASST)
MMFGKRIGLVAACLASTGLTVASGGPATAGGPAHRIRLCATSPAPPSGDVVTDGGKAGPSSLGRRSDVWDFRSAPNLHPMRVTVLTPHAHTAAGQIFVAPYSADQMVGQTGSLIIDNSGNPVWFRPLPSTSLQNADFTVQTYRNPRTGGSQPVLTWWQGTIALPPTYTNLPPGAPEPGGCYYIYDAHYHLLRTVHARNGFNADEHEFLLTPHGTALFIASKPVRMDLRPFGGPKNGAIEDSEVQEVSLSTGRLVFSWDMLKHVSPANSEVSAASASSTGGVWDAFHMNSIDLGPAGQLLISARNTWAVYDVSKADGKILWQLGGKKSDFSFGPNARFYWQHDARFRPGNKISMFDDGCCNMSPPSKPEQQSHGLILTLNFRSRRATVSRTYYHQPRLYSQSQGDTQALANGDEFIGWGQVQYYSEYAGAGNTRGQGLLNLVYDAKMPGSNISYRVFRNVWVGTPYYPPSVAVRARGRSTAVYASWNGSTLTRAWEILAGPRPGSLSPVARAGRTGFETAVIIRRPGPYYQVKALNAAGRVLGASPVVKRSG